MRTRAKVLYVWLANATGLNCETWSGQVFLANRARILVFHLLGIGSPLKMLLKNSVSLTIPLSSSAITLSNSWHMPSSPTALPFFPLLTASLTSSSETSTRFPPKLHQHSAGHALEVFIQVFLVFPNLSSKRCLIKGRESAKSCCQVPLPSLRTCL